MAKKKTKKQLVRGTEERPRLSVFRSSTNIFAQIIDDVKGNTLVAASSLKIDSKTKKDSAVVVGKELAEKAKALKIAIVIFDRGRYVYKGRIAALADSARKNGLVF